MITPSFNLTATERVLPKMALDFTAASLDPRVTFTRALATATRTNASGLIEGVAADTPRFDYDPVTLACKGLLIEEARINLLTYSSTFDDVSWTKYGGGTLSSGATTSPDGTINAYSLITPNATGGVGFTKTSTVTATTYTQSIYAKMAGKRFIQMYWSGAASANYVNFDLQNGVLGSGTYADAKITPVGDGWYRCSLTSNLAAGNYVSAVGIVDSSNSARAGGVTGDGISGIYYYGAQLEAGAFPTSYIPTTTTALTRNADVAKMTGTNFSDWWYASEGAAVIQALPSTISNTRPAIRFDDNTANESIELRGVAADPQLFVVDGGITQATLDAGTITANTVYKLGGAWKASSFATAINGAAAVTSASGTLPTVTQARLGSNSTNYFNGHLQNLRYWPQRLTNSEVQAFSK